MSVQSNLLHFLPKTFQHFLSKTFQPINPNSSSKSPFKCPFFLNSTFASFEMNYKCFSSTPCIWVQEPMYISKVLTHTSILLEQKEIFEVRDDLYRPINTFICSRKPARMRSGADLLLIYIIYPPLYAAFITSKPLEYWETTSYLKVRFPWPSELGTSSWTRFSVSSQCLPFPYHPSNMKTLNSILEGLSAWMLPILVLSVPGVRATWLWEVNNIINSSHVTLNSFVAGAALEEDKVLVLSLQ